MDFNEKDFEGLVWGTYDLLLKNIVMNVNKKGEKTFYLPVEVKQEVCDYFIIIDVLCERNENFKKINQSRFAGCAT